MENNITAEMLKAFAAFQGEFTSVGKDKKNDFLKNKYATLDSIIDAVKPVLSKNGLSFIQLLSSEGVETVLLHSSGGVMTTGVMQINAQLNRGISEAQAIGISTTYTKRYQLGSLLGISTHEDTDGQYGDNQNLTPAQQTPLPPKKTELLISDTEKWMKAVKYLQGGGTMGEVKKGYTLSETTENQLKEAVLNG